MWGYHRALHLKALRWGRPGYAAMARGFALGLCEIWAVTDPDNERSASVCKKLGMRLLGTTHRWYCEVSLMFWIGARDDQQPTISPDGPGERDRESPPTTLSATGAVGARVSVGLTRGSPTGSDLRNGMDIARFRLPRSLFNTATVAILLALGVALPASRKRQAQMARASADPRPVQPDQSRLPHRRLSAQREHRSHALHGAIYLVHRTASSQILGPTVRCACIARATTAGRSGCRRLSRPPQAVTSATRAPTSSASACSSRRSPGCRALPCAIRTPDRSQSRRIPPTPASGLRRAPLALKDGVLARGQA